MIFAAASLQTAMDAVAKDWKETTGNTVVVSYGGSPALAKQIEAGAPADVFISASAEWMDVLQAEGLIEPATRRDLFGNSLVLIAHDLSTAPVELGPGFDLAGLLAGGKLAMALVDSVPAGQYGKQSLEALGIWAMVEGSVAQVENVRVALALVASGEAPFGIVYSTDARAESRVKIVATFPKESHSPIIYPAALVAGGKPEARDFLASLSGEKASAIFAEQGFTEPD